MEERERVKRAEAQRRYYEKNREKVRERQRVRWATPAKKAQRREYLSDPEVQGRMREYGKKYRHSEKGRAVAKRAVRRHRLKKLYGISSAEYARMLDAQKGVCAICGGVNANGYPLFVDHHHKTKRVRELLCIHCNSVVGHCREDTRVLERAAEYIRKHLTIL